MARTLRRKDFSPPSADGRLTGKVAIVTGGGHGIGRAAAELFSRHGATVLVTALHEDSARRVAEGIAENRGSVSHLKVDVTKIVDVERMVKVALDRYGRIDILCQNPGISTQAALEDLTEEIWDRTFALNLRGAYMAIRACVPVMKRQRYGRIVVTSSITGPITGVAGFSHYGASKAGLIGFMRGAAIELARYNVTINAVQPGTILTEGLRQTMKALGVSDFEAQAKTIPMGRLGSPDEVAYAMLFLASDESRYITGQSIVVDGGQVLPESGYSVD